MDGSGGVSQDVITCPIDDDTDSEPGLRLRPLERDIVELFIGLDEVVKLKGEYIAKTLKKNAGTIRKPLAELSQRKKVLQSHPEGGYSRGPRFPEVE